MSTLPSRSNRVELEGAFHLITAASAAKSANDSLEQSRGRGGSKPKRQYITRVRVGIIASSLNDRQWRVLKDVARLGVISGTHIERLHYDGSAAGSRLARKELSGLVQLNVLARLERRIGGVRAGSAGHVYALGLAGQRVLYPSRSRYRPPWTPRPSYLRHALSVSELYVCLREAERGGGMTLITYDTEPHCWRHYSGPGGGRLSLKPDAFVITHVGNFEDRYFVEADCSTEPGTRIRAKAREYVRYWQSGREEGDDGVFPFVLWVAPNDARATFLVESLAALPAEDWKLFAIATQDDAAERMAAGAYASITNEREEVNL